MNPAYNAIVNSIIKYS